ncbi:FecCD family ABC transporter permease [Bacillus massiliglaciei]|uniref:FecCD family ABC transporter permease n=1 Tax=Bacillus massiliglaciei TaxID=1816693 RepID=UPI00389954F8
MLSILSPAVIVLLIIASVLYNGDGLDIKILFEAIFYYDETNVKHAIIMTSRLPRVIAALAVGAFLAISGAVMQGMTRNYLASPSIMGVTDGSVFIITVCLVFLPQLSSLQMIVFSMAGSLLGAGIVFGFGSIMRNGLSPVRLAIIGTVIGTFLSSLSAAVASYFQVSQDVSFWYNAKLHQTDPEMLKWAIPFGIIGILIALSISKSITLLSLGEEVSVSLGQRTRLVKALGILSVVCLTGTAVALVGKIGFVGLVIPHIARFLTGVDYKRIIPYSGLIGGVFLALCDLLSRMVNAPFETPVGVITAIVGVPFFLYLIRTRGGRNHA